MAARTILHVDMDAFYAAVEELDDPSLRGKALIVGGSRRRGVVLSASYAARKFGVRSAIPMAEATRLAPHAIVVPPRMGRYAEISEQVFAIFERFTPLVEGLSIDEAFLDVTASRALFGDGESIARQLKDAIRSELGLTASAGVAPSKFVAKIASDLRKPDGLVVVAPGEVARFLAPLPIERMWGIGPKTAPRFHALGLHTFADLANATTDFMERHFGAHGADMQALARGEDGRHVEPERAAKSVGAEITYDEDLTTWDDVDRTLLAHAGRVASRLVAADLAACVVVVKLKYADFTVRSRRATLDEPASDTTTLYETARTLARGLPLAPVRLTGVAGAALVPRGVPTTLFPDETRKRRNRVEDVVQRVRARFEDDSITTREDDAERPPRFGDSAVKHLLVPASLLEERKDGKRR